MPVCGSDGITYPNECEMERAACVGGTAITLEYQGHCGTKPQG